MSGRKVSAHVLTFSILLFPGLLAAGYYTQFGSDEEEKNKFLRERYPAKAKASDIKLKQQVEFINKMRGAGGGGEEVDNMVQGVLKGGRDGTNPGASKNDVNRNGNKRSVVKGRGE